jgi:hypothetical protein
MSVLSLALIAWLLPAVVVGIALAICLFRGRQATRNRRLEQGTADALLLDTSYKPI